jgi:hypothetical protein
MHHAYPQVSPFTLIPTLSISGRTDFPKSLSLIEMGAGGNFSFFCLYKRTRGFGAYEPRQGFVMGILSAKKRIYLRLFAGGHLLCRAKGSKAHSAGLRWLLHYAQSHSCKSRACPDFTSG